MKIPRLETDPWTQALVKKFIVSPFTNSVAEGALSRGTLAVPSRQLFEKHMLACKQVHPLP